MDPDGDMRGIEAALDAVPVAAVLVSRDRRVVWANRVALRLASDSNDLDSSRLFEALAASEPAAEATRTGTTVQGPLRLVTDLGVVDRIITAAPLPAHDLVVVTFAPPGTALVPEQDEIRERLEAMLEHTAEMITVLDPDGTIRFSNAAAGRLTGLSGAEVNGRFAFDLIHPDDLERVAVAYDTALRTPGPSERVEFRIRFADGTWHDVEATVNNLIGTPRIDGLVVSLRDITDRKAAEAKREKLIANLSDVIVVLNEQFEVTFASDSISNVIDAPPDTNIGMSAFNDIHPDDLSAAIEALGAVASGPPGETVRVEVRLESRPGTGAWRWMEATAVNLLEDDAVRGIVITLHDVTDQKQAAMHLQQSYERERQNAERLVELDRLKDDFLATVSHELRTPLAAIVGFADLIRRANLDEQMRQDLVGRISASAADMRSMIDNVLDFSALEAGSVKLDLRPVNLREVVDGVLVGVAHQVASHLVDDRIPNDAVLVADEHGLGHVIRNLVTNAAKYSDPGSTITLRSSTSADRVIVEIVDEGIGIDESDRRRIFERFYRAPTASFIARGSGIGLNIARRYIELMHGALDVVSVPGRGSTFSISLPSA